MSLCGWRAVQTQLLTQYLTGNDLETGLDRVFLRLRGCLVKVLADSKFVCCFFDSCTCRAQQTPKKKEKKKTGVAYRNSPTWHASKYKVHKLHHSLVPTRAREVPPPPDCSHLQQPGNGRNFGPRRARTQPPPPPPPPPTPPPPPRTHFTIFSLHFPPSPSPLRHPPPRPPPHTHTHTR